MAEVGKANTILLDPEQKAVYDRWVSKGIVLGELLGGMDQVNRFTFFLCSVTGNLPDFV